MTDMTTEYNTNQIVYVHYKNWEGKIAWRRIVPMLGSLRFDSTAWHPEPQWVMDVYDCDKQAKRTFAPKDILEWRTTPPEQPPESSTDGVRPQRGDHEIVTITRIQFNIACFFLAMEELKELGIIKGGPGSMNIVEYFKAVRLLGDNFGWARPTADEIRIVAHMIQQECAEQSTNENTQSTR